MLCLMKPTDLTQKKHRLDQFLPLDATLARNLDDCFRIELTYTSNALAGNTLTRMETAEKQRLTLAEIGRTLDVLK